MFRSIAIATTVLLASAGLTTTTSHAAGTVRSAVSLSAPASGVYGSTIVLRGRVWRYGTSTGLTGATVYLQRSVHGKRVWGNLRSGRAVSGGYFAFSVTQSSAFDYRIYYAGSTTYTRAYSPVRYPVTTQKVAFDSIATINDKTGQLKATGRVWPVPRNGTVMWLQRWTGSSWVNQASGKVASGKVSVTAYRPGSVAYYRLMIPTRYPYGAGVSALRGFSHYVWRGAFDRPVSAVTGSGSTHIAFKNATQDPDRDEATIGIDHHGWIQVTPDTTRCNAAHATTIKVLRPDGDLQVQLLVNRQEYSSLVIHPSDAGASIGAFWDQPSNLDYIYKDLSSTIGSTSTLNLRLRCAG